MQNGNSDDSMELEQNFDDLSSVAAAGLTREPQPYIIEQLLSYLEDKNLELTEGLLTETLRLELMDILEQPYF